MMVDLSSMKSDSKTFSKIWGGIVAEVTWSGMVSSLKCRSPSNA
jgi:hypothetical protein